MGALSLVSALIGYLRGGEKETKKQLEAATKERDSWKNLALDLENHVTKLERQYIMLKKDYGETLTDDELRLLASKLQVGGRNGTSE